jgi:hypothetical protein
VRLAPPTRKRQLPRPGITLALGTANEEDPIGIGRQQQRDGGVRSLRHLGPTRRGRGQLGHEALKPHR